jgi:hypothetical protein
VLDAGSAVPNHSPRTSAPSIVAMRGDTSSQEEANTEPAPRTTTRLSECPRIDPAMMR